jgi:hypothetical protein
VTARGAGILAANGGATMVRFGASTSVVSVSAVVAESLAIGDFDADGDADIAVGEASGIRFYSSNGDGTLSASGTASPPSGTSIAQIESGDLDCDGEADDLMVSGFEFPNKVLLGVYLNTASGGTLAGKFASPVKRTDTTYKNMVDLAITDFQADSVFDAATGDGLRISNDVIFVNNAASSSDDVVGVSRFNGASFGSVNVCTYVSDPTAIAVGDLDGDRPRRRGDRQQRRLVPRDARADARSRPLVRHGVPVDRLRLYIPQISAASKAYQGTTASIDLSGARPSVGAVLAVSPVAQLTDLSGVSNGSNLYLGFPLYLLPSASGIAVSGSGTASLTFAVHPTLFLGERLYFQWAVFDSLAPAGYTLSDALLVRIGK